MSMKKILIALLAAGGMFAAYAGEDCAAACDGAPAPWKATLGKVKDLSGDTGISGFIKKEAPDYITGNFAMEKRIDAKLVAGLDPHHKMYMTPNGYYDAKGEWHGGYFSDSGAFVAGHQVKTLFGMPYGVGQLIMIPICLLMIYLAIVKGFEPLLLLPIGFGGLLANCPLAGVTAPAMMHDGMVSILASGVPVMSGGIVEPGGFLHYFFSFGIDTGVFRS